LVYDSQASVAKLETSLSVVGSNLELKLYGYNDKLSILLSHILAASQSFSPKMDRFEVICFYAEDMIDYIEYKCGNVFYFHMFAYSSVPSPLTSTGKVDNLN
jgi:secreted Zn-dependent insulinase-like peptidase